MSKPRYFVDGVAKVDPDRKSGIVKIDFTVNDEAKDEEVIQLITSAGDLQNIMRTIGETMQKKFGGGLGRPGGPGGPRGPSGRDAGVPGGKGAFKGFKDLTRD